MMPEKVSGLTLLIVGLLIFVGVMALSIFLSTSAP